MDLVGYALRMGGSQTRPEKGGGVWLERDSEITAHQPIGQPVGQTFAAWQWFGLGARWATLDGQVGNGTKGAGGQSKGPLYQEVKPKFVLILYQNGFSNSYSQHQIFQLFLEPQLWWSEFMRYTNWKLSLSPSLLTAAIEGPTTSINVIIWLDCPQY